MSIQESDELINIKEGLEEGDLLPVKLEDLSLNEGIGVKVFLSENYSWNEEETLRLSKKPDNIEKYLLDRLIKAKVFIPLPGKPNIYYVNIIEKERDKVEIRGFRRTSGIDFSFLFK